MNLKRLFYLRMHGFNAIEIADDMKLDPVTIRNKLRELKKMDEKSFKALMKETIGGLI